MVLHSSVEPTLASFRSSSMIVRNNTAKRKLAHERGMSAWLLTWEQHGVSGQKPARRRIAAILDPRTKSETVKTIVQTLHNASQYTLSEQAGFANRRMFDPYPAEYLRWDGTQFEGRIMCGHNPYLYARLVNKLKIIGRPGDEEVTWVDRPLPESLQRRLNRISSSPHSESE
jgi:hypothetical protein